MKAKKKTPIAPPKPQDYNESRFLHRGMVMAAIASILLVIVFAIYLSQSGVSEEEPDRRVQQAQTGIIESANVPPILQEGSDEEFEARRAALARAREAAKKAPSPDTAKAEGGAESDADARRARVRALSERLRALQEGTAHRRERPSSPRDDRSFYQEQLERRRRAGRVSAGAGLQGSGARGVSRDDRHGKAVEATPPIIAGAKVDRRGDAPRTSGNSHADLLRSAQKLAESRGDGAMSQMLASLADVYEETTAVGEGGDSDMGSATSSLHPTPRPAGSGQAERSSVLRLEYPVTPYEVKQGTVIPAILETAINSDIPGGVRGRTTRNVYDTQTQQNVLIPKNSTLIGEAGSEQGSNRLAIVWTRVILPDGRAIDLGGQETKDGAGASGLRGDVDNHFFRRFRSAFLVSMVGAGVKIATYDERRSAFERPRVGQVAGSSAAEQTGEVATELLRRGMNIRPTVKIPPGQAFHVYVNEDLAFEAPYRPVDGYITQW